MASFDRKAFLSLPTGSSYLECPLGNNYYSLYTGPSTEIFCGVKPLLKCPLPYLVRNVPFLWFGIWLFLLCPVSGCDRSAALRRALCGAVRAQRRPQPETAAMT